MTESCYFVAQRRSRLSRGTILSGSDSTGVIVSSTAALPSTNLGDRRLRIFRYPSSNPLHFCLLSAATPRYTSNPRSFFVAAASSLRLLRHTAFPTFDHGRLNAPPTTTAPCGGNVSTPYASLVRWVLTTTKRPATGRIVFSRLAGRLPRSVGHSNRWWSFCRRRTRSSRLAFPIGDFFGTVLKYPRGIVTPSPQDPLPLLITVASSLFWKLDRILSVPFWVALAATFLPVDSDADTTVNVALLRPRNLPSRDVYVVCGGER